LRKSRVKVAFVMQLVPATLEAPSKNSQSCSLSILHSLEVREMLPSTLVGSEGLAKHLETKSLPFW